MTPITALQWFAVLIVVVTVWERRGELSTLFAELVLAAARLASHACWPRVVTSEIRIMPLDVSGTAEEIYGMSKGRQ